MFCIQILKSNCFISAKYKFLVTYLCFRNEYKNYDNNKNFKYKILLEIIDKIICCST